MPTNFNNKYTSNIHYSNESIVIRYFKLCNCSSNYITTRYIKMNDLTIRPTVYIPRAFHSRKEIALNCVRPKAPPQLSFEEKWYNNISQDINLIYPGDKNIRLKSNHGLESNQRGITIERNFKWQDKKVDFNVKDLYFEEKDGKQLLSMDSNIKDSQEPKHVFQKMLMEAAKYDQYHDTHMGTVTIFISEEELSKNNYAMYIEELSVVITTPKHSEYMVHPASAASYAAAQLDAIDTPIAIQLFANDPKGNEYSKRYINLNGHVIPVPVVSESGMAPGVYQSIPYENGTENAAFKLEHQPFDKADAAFNLYKDKESALNHFGAVTAAVENSMREQEVLYNELKRKLEIEHKLKIDEYKEAAERRKEETAQLMEELDRRKAERNDKYDSASTSRKTWSETIKWLPAIITGVITVVGVCVALLL